MSTTYVNTIDSLPLYADRAEKDAAGNTITTTYATKSEVTTGLASKEDSANKAQSINTSSTTDFPSSKATADFVNSSVATNTAKFLGNFTLTDLSLTYPATDAQIETALDGYTFSPAPTNNDYVYVEIQDPQTPGVTDVVKRFKFDGTNWLYEYSLNNSSFTAAEIAAIDSGINSTKVTAYDTHVADTTIHVTSTDKTTWDGKQDAISDLQTIRTGAGLGATAVQPGDLATVATSGDYDDLLNKPDLSVYAESADLATVATTGAYSDLAGTPTIRNVPPVTPSDDNKVLKASYTGGVGSYSWEQESGGTVTDVEVDGTSVVNASGVAEITMPTVPALKALTAGNNITITEGANSVTIAAASSSQVNADWDAVSGVAQILNKPSLATVATTGDYTDLTNKPTIPSGVQLVPAATSADADKVLTVDAQGTPAWSTPAPGGVTDVEVDGTSVVNASGVAEITMPTIPVTDVEVDGVSVVSSGVASITMPAVPTVDQTYDGTSTNAQSGTAVASAISGKQDTLTAGTNITISSNTISATDTTYSAGTGIDITGTTISVDTPVDIVAGPGIVIDNPDGNTLRVSADENYEVSLYENSTGATTVTLSESASNFEYIAVWVLREGYTSYTKIPNGRNGIVYNNYGHGNTWLGISCSEINVNDTSVSIGSTDSFQISFTISGGVPGFRYANKNAYGTIVKVVGIHRIANN